MLQRNLPIFGIFLLALILRGIYLIEIKANPFFDNPSMDPFYHDQWAMEIVKGDWLGKEAFFRAPLYPYLLASFYLLFGHNYFWARVGQILFGSLSCVLIYFLGKKIYTPKIGLIASLLASFYGIFIYFEGELLITFLEVFLDLSILLLLLRAEEKPEKKRWLLAGLALGLSALARPNVLLFVPFVLIWIYIAFQRLKPFPKMVPFFLSFLGGIIIIISPITLRNYWVGKDFVLISSQAGINFYLGNNPQSDGMSAVLPGVGDTWDEVAIAEEAVGRRLKPSEVSNFWLGQALKFIREEPLNYGKLLFKKLYLFWNGLEISDSQNIYFFRENSLLLSILIWKFGLFFPFGFIAPLALTGILLSLKEWRKILLPLFFIFSYQVSVILFFVCARYRVPVIPFLLFFAAYSLNWVYQVVRGKFYKSLLPFAASFLFFFLLVNSNLYGLGLGDFAREFFSLGNAWSRKGLYDQAIASYEKGLKLNPRYPKLHLNLGTIYYRRGWLNKAFSEYLEELKINPREEKAHHNLGVLFRREGKYEKALFAFKTALKLRPEYEEAHLNLGLTYMELGKNEEAKKEFEYLVQKEFRAPDIFHSEGRADLRPEAHYYLGLLYEREGSLKIAKEEFTRALQIRPDFEMAKNRLNSISTR